MLLGLIFVFPWAHFRVWEPIFRPQGLIFRPQEPIFRPQELTCRLQELIFDAQEAPRRLPETLLRLPGLRRFKLFQNTAFSMVLGDPEIKVTQPREGNALVLGPGGRLLRGVLDKQGLHYSGDNFAVYYTRSSEV